MFTHLHVHSHFSLGAGRLEPRGHWSRRPRRAGSPPSPAPTPTASTARSSSSRPPLARGIRADPRRAPGARRAGGGGARHRRAGLGGAVPGDHGDSLGGEQAERRNGNRDRRSGGPAVPARPSPFPLVLSSLLATDRDGLSSSPRTSPSSSDVVRRSGPRDLYAELRPGKERHAVGAAARRLGIPAVVTGGVMFANPEDWARHRLRVAIARNTTMAAGRLAVEPSAIARPPIANRRPPSRPATPGSAPPPISPATSPTAPTRSPGPRSSPSGASYRIPVGHRVVAPRFADADDAFARLRTLAYEGAERRYGTIAPVTRDRLEHELAIIGQKGFADYFLVVHDIVQHGPTHCGRGSVANSIVSYCLGITHVDPLGAGLLFERFLNPGAQGPARHRPRLPLGRARPGPRLGVPQAIPIPARRWWPTTTASGCAARCARWPRCTAGPPGEIREVTRRFPWFMRRRAARRAARHAPQLPGPRPARRSGRTWPGWPSRWWACRGISRSIPGGVVIVPERAHRLRAGGAGGQGARRLSRPHGAGDPVREGRRRGRRAGEDRPAGQPLAGGDPRRDRRGAGEHRPRRSTTPRSDPEDDEPTRALFRTGQTMGVFYTESPASRLLCAKSRADTFELLVLNTSIIRPASNRFIRIYLERLHGGALRAARPVAPRHPGRDLRGDGLPGGRGERLRHVRRACRSPPATGCARRSPRSGR